MKTPMTYEDVVNILSAQRFTWVVTGAAGFIGSHLAERLLSLNQKVVAIDDLSTGLERNIEALRVSPNFQTSFEFIRADIAESKAYGDRLEVADFVLHQAALGSVPVSIENPAIFHRANVDGFFRILNASREASIKKFVYASSSAVYGDDPTLPKSEDDLGRPLSPYAATKLIDETYASVFANVYEMPVIGLRYFNVFGPRQNPAGAYAAVIPSWLRAMLDGKDVFINGDGTFSRDFCFIENVVRANLLAAFAPAGAHGQAYNIADGGRTTLLELFGLMKSVVEEQTGKTVAPPVFRDFRQGDIPHSVASIERAAADFGYRPAIGIREGLAKTVQAFL